MSGVGGGVGGRGRRVGGRASGPWPCRPSAAAARPQFSEPPPLPRLTGRPIAPQAAPASPKCTPYPPRGHRPRPAAAMVAPAPVAAVGDVPAAGGVLGVLASLSAAIAKPLGVPPQAVSSTLACVAAGGRRARGQAHRAHRVGWSAPRRAVGAPGRRPPPPNAKPSLLSPRIVSQRCGGRPGRPGSRAPLGARVQGCAVAGWGGRGGGGGGGWWGRMRGPWRLAAASEAARGAWAPAARARTPTCRSSPHPPTRTRNLQTNGRRHHRRSSFWWWPTAFAPACSSS